MLPNPPYFKKWLNTNIQRGKGAIVPFRTNFYLPNNFAWLPLFFNFSMMKTNFVLDICSNYMKGNMNTDNVLDLITFADILNNDDLKNVSMDFILNNVKKVKENPKLKELPQKLVVEILENVVSQQSTNKRNMQ